MDKQLSLCTCLSVSLSLCLSLSLSLSLSDALLHVATITSPEELFQLLPPSGNIKFFLPVIERSCKLYMAKQISGHLHANLSS